MLIPVNNLVDGLTHHQFLHPAICVEAAWPACLSLNCLNVALHPQGRRVLPAVTASEADECGGGEKPPMRAQRSRAT